MRRDTAGLSSLALSNLFLLAACLLQVARRYPSQGGFCPSGLISPWSQGLKGLCKCEVLARFNHMSRRSLLLSIPSPILQLVIHLVSVYYHWFLSRSHTRHHLLTRHHQVIHANSVCDSLMRGRLCVRSIISSPPTSNHVISSCRWEAARGDARLLYPGRLHRLLREPF